MKTETDILRGSCGHRAANLPTALCALLLVIGAGAVALPSAAFAFSYINIPGSAFSPRNSSTTWSYAGTGCLSRTAGSELFAHKLQLPQDAVINYLRIYYNDASSADVTGYITEYDSLGAVSDLTSVASSGTAGFGSALSPALSYTVDNVSHALVVNVAFDASDAALSICGVRIAYTADRIFANGFD